MKKKILFLSITTLFLTACGGSEESSSTQTTASTTTASKPAMEPGELLIVKSDCIGCHKKDEKMIGPSYEEIAQKYPSTDENIALLASKIIKGGKGVWGPIPMTPHSNITDDEAKTMVKYILSFKK